MPSAPEPSDDEQRGDRAEPALDRRAGRSRARARRRTGSRGRRRRTARPGSATTRRRPGRRSRRGRSPRGWWPRWTIISSAGTSSAATVITGARVRSSRDRGALGEPAAALGGLAAAARAPVLAHPDLVADALELRRSLAQPGAAVRALGHVRADLGAAALADDGQLGVAHLSEDNRPRALVRAACARRSRRPGREGRPCRRRNRRAGGARRCRSRAGPRPTRAPAAQPSAAASSASSSTSPCAISRAAHLLAGAEVDQLAVGRRGARRGSCCRRSARSGTRPAARSAS